MFFEQPSNEDSYESKRSEGLNIYKLAGTLYGFIGLTSATTLLCVTSTLLPKLLPGTVILLTGGVITAIACTVLSASLSKNPMFLVMSAFSTIALILGSILGGREAFFYWLSTLNLLGLDGFTMAAMAAIVILALVASTLIGRFRKD